MESCPVVIPVLGKKRGTQRDIWNHKNRCVDVETKLTAVKLHSPENNKECSILPEVKSSPFRGIPADDYKTTVIEIDSSDEDNWKDFRKGCVSFMNDCLKLSNESAQKSSNKKTINADLYNTTGTCEEDNPDFVTTSNLMTNSKSNVIKSTTHSNGNIEVCAKKTKVCKKKKSRNKTKYADQRNCKLTYLKDPELVNLDKVATNYKMSENFINNKESGMRSNNESSLIDIESALSSSSGSRMDNNKMDDCPLIREKLIIRIPIAKLSKGKMF